MVDARYVMFRGQPRNRYFTTGTSGRWRWQGYAVDGLVLSGRELGQRVHQLRPKVLPRLDLLGRCRRSQNGRLAIWRQLAQRFLVAVIRLVLRDQHEVRLEIELAEVSDARSRLLLRDGKL